jgi:hypothetical protein
MRWMKTLVAAAAGVLAALALLEALLRPLPVAMGLFRTVDYAAWPLRGYTPHAAFTYSRTWEMLMANHGFTNNFGHIAPFDYARGSNPVLVIGDSFVAAELIPYADSIQAQMAALLGGRLPVYGFGFNGNSLSDYLATAALAAGEFSPRAAVLVIVDGDISESVLSQSGHYFFAREGGRIVLHYRPMIGRSLFTRVREAVGDIALYKYIFANLQFSLVEILAPQKFAAPKPREPVPDSARDKSLARAAVDTFVDEFARRARVAPQCVVLLLDSDRYALYSPDLANDHPIDGGAELSRYLAASASARSYRVVDLGPVFAADYAMHRAKFDYWPVDRHWNRRGHGIAAASAVHALTTATPSAPACLSPPLSPQ